MDTEYLFYCYESNAPRHIDYNIDSNYKIFIWKPSKSSIIPLNLTIRPFFIWWVFHYLKIFKNNDYSILVVYYREKLIHRSVISPKYFRFPFMRSDDLQIGDIWTDPSHRRKGIATDAIKKIVSFLGKPGRSFWYVVQRNNLPSIRAIEKVGFKLIGEGTRVKKFGTKLLGSFKISIYK